MGGANVRTVHDLDVYRLAFEAAMDVFHLTKAFPPEERYSLTDQMRRSSRSVASNIREGFAKRRYKAVFLRHLTDSLGSSEETRAWLDFSLRCGYISEAAHQDLAGKYDRACAMLYRMISNWF